MRFQFLIVLVMTLAGAGTFWYLRTAADCPVPLSYRIGTIDPSFTLDTKEAQEYVAKAEAVWESAAGRDLFTYSEEGSLVVNFVFDQRQAEANSESQQRAHLDEEKEKHEALFRTIEELKKEHEVDSKEYEEKTARYEERLAAYNGKVTTYNDGGGAPATVFPELEAEKVALNKEAESLSKTADQLNEVTAKINELGDQANQLVDTYNHEVETYNSQFGYSREFTQGDYHDGVIQVYKFSDEHELSMVLTHELGHALGIDHVDDEDSVMYYLLKDTDGTPVLSQEDEDAFVAECGSADQWDQRVRAFIRSLLSA